MVYISIFSFGVFWLLVFKQFNRNKILDSIISFNVFLILWAVPSLQHNVGTDYFSYISIYNDPSALDYYARKYEYGFYYVVVLLKEFDFDAQSLFVVVGFIQTALFINFIRISFKKESYVGLALIFTFFFFTTNVFHNQMNVIRAYVSVLCFLNSIIYLRSGSAFLSFLFFILGACWHKSIIFTLPLYFIGSGLSIWLINRALRVFLASFIIFGSGVLYNFIGVIVEVIAPMYKHYLTSKERSISFLLILTKLYYYPFYIVFIYHLRKFDVSKFNKIDIALISTWLLTINSVLFIFYFARFNRVFYFFSPFLFVPFYYLYVMKKPFWVFLGLIFTFAAYFAKVVIFPTAEFSYESIIFL